MKHTPVLVSLLASLGLALAPGCASATEAPAAAMAAEKDGHDSDKARELEALERKLGVARARLEKTRLEHELAEREHEVRVRQASASFEIAEAGLSRFREADAPNELARLRLDLRSARDRAQEAAEELAQIEIMYAEQDLDDLTAEFVVSRGRRAAERAAARIEIDESRLQSVEQREHPVKLRELTMAVEKAAHEREKLDMEGEIASRGRAIALQEAEAEIVRLEQELADLRNEAKP